MLEGDATSPFIQFAPLFLVLSPCLLTGLKKERDSGVRIGVAFVCILLVQCFYMLIGFPQWLAEITLFRFRNRMNMVYGWTATLFTIWGFHILDQYPNLLD